MASAANVGGSSRLLAISGENRVALSPPYGPAYPLERFLMGQLLAVQEGLFLGVTTAGPFWN